MSSDNITRPGSVVHDDDTMHSTNRTDGGKGPQAIVLFYKYHPLSDDFEVMEMYRSALDGLCASLALKGRILVGCSKAEGLNGTLSGHHDHVHAFTLALLHDSKQTSTLNHEFRQAIETFWMDSQRFFEKIQEPELIFESPSDFKWSTTDTTDALFPDLNIKLTKELIGSGGVMLEIPVGETSKGYLTPSEWHQELTEYLTTQSAAETKQTNHSTSLEDTVLIDCRNTKEYEIGRFPSAIDPQTTTYSQFSHWVDRNQTMLEGKRVLMYCTGGIRCEKASAYIRRNVDSVKEVKHLKGGIHKYLEEYGSDGLWQGKNFVFDSRQASSAEETRQGKEGQVQQPLTDVNDPDQHEGRKSDIVGKCLYCQAPYDTFGAHCVCAVCREPVLVCHLCQQATSHGEFHCRQHFHLKDCYFANLERCSVSQLRQQLASLEAERQQIAVGRRFKQKRQTLAKQCTRVQKQIETINQQHKQDEDDSTKCVETSSLRLNQVDTSIPKLAKEESKSCRSCGEVSCDGRCWGFYSLKRKKLLEQKKLDQDNTENKLVPSTSTTVSSSPPHLKRRRRGVDSYEIERLQYHQPPSSFRHSSFHPDIRCPPCRTRVIQTFVKAKWCGKSILQVLSQEFVEFSSISGKKGGQSLQAALRNGLIQVNQVSVSQSDASHMKLKNGDLLGRALHWHEAPVLTPPHISVQKVSLPYALRQEYGMTESEAHVLVCDKPSSVPVHPAGPFLANALTIMVQAQENIDSLSLKPLHRTDRVTSGLTLLSTSSLVAKIFNKCLSESTVEKLYIAKVGGHFPSNQRSVEHIATAWGDVGTCLWQDGTQTVLVEAPIYTPDPMSGVRIVSEQGKASSSIFKFLGYNPEDDTSLVACFPITGRNHQLRVHLQAMDCPIVGDIQYGGRRYDKATVAEETVLEVMRRCVDDEQPSDPSRTEEADASRRVCPSCIYLDAPENSQPSFNKAQLLQEGHMICLHALRYRVAFYGRKKRDAVAFAEFGVDLPPWTHGDVAIAKEITWYQ